MIVTSALIAGAVLVALGAALAAIILLPDGPSRTLSENVPTTEGQETVGDILILSEPILAGRGKIMNRGRVWELSGPDLDAGAAVRVVAANGNRLFVEPQETPPASSLPKAGTFGG